VYAGNLFNMAIASHLGPKSDLIVDGILNPSPDVKSSYLVAAINFKIKNVVDKELCSLSVCASIVESNNLSFRTELAIEHVTGHGAVFGALDAFPSKPLIWLVFITFAAQFYYWRVIITHILWTQTW
jgi:hypothetical protein